MIKTSKRMIYTENQELKYFLKERKLEIKLLCQKH